MNHTSHITHHTPGQDQPSLRSRIFKIFMGLLDRSTSVLYNSCLFSYGHILYCMCNIHDSTTTRHKYAESQRDTKIFLTVFDYWSYVDGTPYILHCICNIDDTCAEVKSCRADDGDGVDNFSRSSFLKNEICHPLSRDGGMPSDIRSVSRLTERGISFIRTLTSVIRYYSRCCPRISRKKF